MNRILVIRGGAIGDFVLALPAIKLLRDGFPHARLEILGYPHIAALAEKRFYAEAVASIESASLAPFFAPGSDLPAAQAHYFRGFDLIVSYLSDRDGIFEANVRKCGPGTFVAGPSKLDDSEHAAKQLARPLAELGLSLRNAAAQLFPTEADRAALGAFGNRSETTIALHPGSGSERKNWPIEHWLELGDILLAQGHEPIVIAGEADTARAQRLKAAWAGKPVRFVKNLPLPHLAALLEHGRFVGHDSGISHIAAAVGARCLLLFGPTNPAVWAPANKEVTVLRASDGMMERLEVEPVAAALT